MAESAVPSQEQPEASGLSIDTGQERAIDVGGLEDTDSSSKKGKAAKAAVETKTVQDGESHLQLYESYMCIVSMAAL